MKNGYNDSRFDTTAGVCYICGRRTSTARHEIFFGPNRKISKREGFWVDVCPTCHQHGPRAIHKFPLEGYDRILKEKAQEMYEVDHTRDEFRQLIGVSYL